MRELPIPTWVVSHIQSQWFLVLIDFNLFADMRCSVMCSVTVALMAVLHHAIFFLLGSRTALGTRYVWRYHTGLVTFTHRARHSVLLPLSATSALRPLNNTQNDPVNYDRVLSFGRGATGQSRRLACELKGRVDGVRHELKDRLCLGILGIEHDIFKMAPIWSRWTAQWRARRMGKSSRLNYWYAYMLFEKFKHAWTPFYQFAPNIS